jgi:hypothetical protein
MKCLDCPLKYVGQTGRTFNALYKEHIQVVRTNNNNSGYSNHILNTGRTYDTASDTCGHYRGGKGRETLKQLREMPYLFL